jgi:hypothetical protein
LSNNVFKHLEVDLVTRTSKKDCNLIVNNLKEILGAKIIPFGSTCNSEWSGDVDAVVECKNKMLLWNKLCNNFEEVKKCGSLFSILYHHKPTGLVQVDLLPSSNPEHDAWSLAGGLPGGVKGKYLNMALCYLAKKMSIDLGFKITFASPGGLGQPGNRITDPQSILDYLKIPCDPKTGMSLEGIVESLVKSNQSNRLIGLDSYIRGPKNQTSDQIERAIKYINTAI